MLKTHPKIQKRINRRYAGQKNNPTDGTFDNIMGMDGFGSKDSKEKSSTKFDDKALLEMVTYKVGFQVRLAVS